MPHRAHFLQGAFSEEELARLGGQHVATLSPITRWEIHNISGVRGELWAAEGAVRSVGGNLSGLQLPRPGLPGLSLKSPGPARGQQRGYSEQCLWASSDRPARARLCTCVCMCTPVPLVHGPWCGSGQPW